MAKIKEPNYGVYKVDEVNLVLERDFYIVGNNKITSSEIAVQIFRQFWNENLINIQEQLSVMLLNQANKVIGMYQHSSGAINATMADTELIAAVAVKSLAKGVIVAHNHPSGNLDPSDADIQLTKTLKYGLQLFNIKLIDSLIIVNDKTIYTSLLDDGKMEDGGMLDESDENKEIELFKNNTKIEINKEGFGRDKKYSVSYENGDMEISGDLIPYYTGRDIQYEFSPSWFNDKETNNYYSNHWEEIEKEILDVFYKKSKQKGGYMADGGEVYESEYIIKNSDGKYFSRNLGNRGNVSWTESQDMAYTYDRDKAESIKSKLEKEGYNGLSIEKYNKDWWKMANGGKIKSPKPNFVEEAFEQGKKAFLNNLKRIAFYDKNLSELIKKAGGTSKAYIDYSDSWTKGWDFEYGNLSAKERLNDKMGDGGYMAKGGEVVSLYEFFYVDGIEYGRLLSQALYSKEKEEKYKKRAKDSMNKKFDEGVYDYKQEVFVHNKNTREPYLDKYKVYEKGGHVEGEWVLYNPINDELISIHKTYRSAKLAMDKTWKMANYEELGIENKKDWDLYHKMADGGYMAKGGKNPNKQEWTAIYVNQQKPNERKVIVAYGNSKKEATLNARMSEAYHGIKYPYELQNIYTSSGNFPMMLDDVYMADGGYMAKGGMVDYSKDGHVKAIRDIDGKLMKEIKVGNDVYRYNSVYKTYNSTKNNELLHKSKYEDGGYMAKEGKLKVGGDDFSFLLELSEKELSKRLDLVRKQQSINANQYFEAKKKGNPTINIEESGKKLQNQETAIIQARMKKMAMGGKVKFSDKVKAIKSSLLKRKNVSPKVQKDYGKTYSPKEAEESAKRIVGAMTARERMMSKIAKK